ncbi:MAG: KH domain-containing protein [bacterium]|nr:KH domain-containing protein [bacterium]
MKNLLEFLLIHLCNHPEDVSITESTDERFTVYTIHVNEEDIGRVIGKNGSIIQSIRNIAKVRAIKEGIHAQVVLAE